jgi:MYXO-CTERM domain-containing protein
MATIPALSHQDYTVGWICALSTELTAAMAMLDEEHLPLERHAQDSNTYTLGRIGEHNVVITCLPAGQVGNNPAAMVAAQMQYSFGAIRFGLMVGIGGGVPSEEHDIRLGDVVTSNPGRHDGGVIQYDFGRTVTEGRFVRTGTLNAPPTVLLTAVNTLKARHDLRGRRFTHHISAMEKLMEKSMYKANYAYLGSENGRLFKAEYDHVGGDRSCDQCDKSELVSLCSCDPQPGAYSCSGSGWDYASGWGTPDVTNLMMDLDNGNTSPVAYVPPSSLPEASSSTLIALSGLGVVGALALVRRRRKVAAR